MSSDDSTLDNDFPEYELVKKYSFGKKQSLKGPRDLNSIYEEKPAPKWPKGMRAFIDYPILKIPQEYPVEEFRKNQVVTIQSDRPESWFKEERVYQSVYDTKTSGPYYTPKGKDDTTLVFESRFESGNLAMAIKTGPQSYNLHVRPDLSTCGHTQWFYFRVTNIKTGIPYRIHIVNLMKPNCLYAKGMRPLMYSENLAKTKGTGWHRIGSDISYTPNPVDPDAEEGVRPLNTLAFTVTFDYDNDTVFFAHCYPYTYSDLQNYLYDLKRHPIKSSYFKHRVIGKTYGGNYLDMLSVTAKADTPEMLKERKGIILSARVHPGETNSSWMMKGFMDFILSEDEQAVALRNHFVIRIIPMLNPDGVIVGNHRCNLNGYDLNRQWNAKSSLTPEIKHVTDMIARYATEREIKMYCDLHGHNRKNGIFIYGCHSEGRGDGRKYEERVFPLMLSQKAPNLFFFKKCRFKIDKSKEGTGRVTIWRTLDVVNSFTLEASFCGSETDLNGGFHYSPRHLEDMGEKIGRTLFVWNLTLSGPVR